MIDVRGEIRIAYPDAPTAQAAEQALGPENGDHLTTRVEGDTLVLMLPERNLASTLHTLDDALACLSAADAAVAGLHD